MGFLEITIVVMIYLRHFSIVILALLGLALDSVEPTNGSAGSTTGSLAPERSGPTANLLRLGKVLVTGGDGNSGLLSSCVFYAPGSGATWNPTAALSTARTRHTATTLLSGKVLVAGGYVDNPDGTASFLTRCELYDPSGATWSSTGGMATGRYWHTVILLPSGKVLAVGGDYQNPLASCELFDPQSGTWSATGAMATGRYYPTLTLLPTGKVLVTGLNKTCELYDPAIGTWSPTGSLPADLEFHTATLLPSGKVLVAGGRGGTGSYLNRCVLYDPQAGTWSATGAMATGRYFHTATLLPSGQVLVAGGAWELADGLGMKLCELYNPATGSWSTATPMATYRSEHTATLLPCGQVLVTCAPNYFDGQGFCELYNPSTGNWSATSRSSGTVYNGYTASLLASGTVLVTGGRDYNDQSILPFCELFNAGLAPTDQSRTGSISREVWTGIPGTALSAIPLSTPANLRDELTTFETPTNWANNYGTRIRGYLCPTVSGPYTFWIASDDHSELWLSSDANSNNRRKIAALSGWTAPRDWSKYPSQQSQSIALTAGHRYYIEALQKDGLGGDNLAVAWQGPGIVRQVIPGSALAVFTVPAMGFVRDLFASATSGADLLGRTADLGGIWKRNTSSAQTGQLVVTPAQRVRSNSTAGSTYYLPTLTPTSDYAVSATITPISLLAGNRAGVVGRVAATGFEYDSARYDAGSRQWQIYRVHAGGFLLGSYVQTLTIGQSYVLTLSRRGAQLILSVDGVARITVTDTVTPTPIARSFVGLRSEGLTTDTTGLHLANFLGQSPASATPTTLELAEPVLVAANG